MNYKTAALLIFLLGYSIITNSQNNSYEFYAKIGMSNHHEQNNESSFIIGNSYDYAPSYSLGGLFVKSFIEDKYKIKTGLEFTSIGTKCGVKDIPETSNLPPIYYTEDTYYLNVGVVPLRFSYAFEKWMYINVGLDNKFLLSKKTAYNESTYTLGYAAGFDFLIKEHYLIGLNYNRDITPQRSIKDSDINYFTDQASLKLTYILK